jgi:mono/diheme cytochrome c family protein
MAPSCRPFPVHDAFHERATQAATRVRTDSLTPALPMNPVSTTETLRHRVESGLSHFSVPQCLGGESLPSSWSPCGSNFWKTLLPLNRSSVAAGVSPAVEGGVSPPGNPRFKVREQVGFDQGASPEPSMQAIARVETGSLTPTLSRREREPRITRSDMPKPNPSEPFRLVPANAQLNPSKPAAPILLLPPGEGRDEGHPLHASPNGSVAPPGLEKPFNSLPMAHAMGFRSFGPPGLRMNRPSVAADVPPTGIPPRSIRRVVLVWLSTLLWVMSAVALPAAEPAHPIIGGLHHPATVSPALAGNVLLSELSCAACHPSLRAASPPKGGPNLSDVGGRLHAHHLRRFLADPATTKPGTTMPDALAGLGASEREHAVLALTQYLASLGGPAPRLEKPTPDAIERGRTLYHSIGCVACHAPEAGDSTSVPLGSLEDKYSLVSLTRFLEDPLTVRPAGRMPNLHLDHFEALDVASYLLREPPPAMLPLPPDRSLAEQGRKLFTQFRCHACHETETPQPASPTFSLAIGKPDRGCLSGTTGPWPRYPLSTAQRATLRTALTEGPTVPDADELVSITLARLNCIACHARGDLGGVTASRDSYFTGKDPNLGEQGRLPPPLTGVGAKLRRDWLREVVVNGTGVRPYLNTRMPKYGPALTEPLVDAFKRLDVLPPVAVEAPEDADKARNVGRELAGSKGFNCVACHTFRERSAAPIRALDLTTLTQRLEPNWFQAYLANPQRFSPLTIMPSFWPDDTSLLPDVLGGHPARQRDALWRYLEQGPEAGEPRGLVLEPLVITVKDEAVMLRRSYPGIGKRGIGVGYPSGINLSFDAGQMRLASLWSGGFIEASGVWRGQGAGNVQILGRDTVSFPAGPAFAVLPSPETAWPTNTARQAEGFQFQGYSLDAQQRPTFRYAFAGVQLEDRFLDVSGLAPKPFFERTLRWTGGPPPPGLHLRVAADEQLEAFGDRDFVVAGKIRFRLPTGGRLRPTEGKLELLLPVTDLTPLVLEYHLIATP